MHGSQLNPQPESRLSFGVSGTSGRAVKASCESKQPNQGRGKGMREPAIITH